jgi:DNA-binding transcriptional LysR family regulator
MDLHRLRHFVAVAEELHFGNAAKKLGMEQPGLSLSITSLEKSVGVRLFDRTSRRVTLTLAGTAFLDDVRRLLEQSQQAVERARAAALRETHQLRVGHVPFSLIQALPPAIRGFKKRYPDVQVRLEEKSSEQQIADLRSGALDLGLVNLQAGELSGLNVRPLYSARLVLAVPSKWPLALRKEVHLGELGDYPFVMFPPEWNHSFTQQMISAMASAGLTPKVSHIAGQALTLMTLVANEFGVALVHESSFSLRMEGVSFVQIAEFPDLLRIEMGLAWLPTHKSQLVTTLVNLLQNLVGEPAKGKKKRVID